MQLVTGICLCTIGTRIWQLFGIWMYLAITCDKWAIRDGKV